jgi:hypothetical protein
MKRYMPNCVCLDGACWRTHDAGGIQRSVKRLMFALLPNEVTDYSADTTAITSLVLEIIRNKCLKLFFEVKIRSLLCFWK